MSRFNDVECLDDVEVCQHPLEMTNQKNPFF